jgi:DNA-binding NarL/FixJ family response regulator
MLAFCRAEYGAVHLWRGRWRDAEHVLEASVEDFARSRPAMVGWPLVALAELRRRQARTDEATRLLDRAGPSLDAQICRARLAIDGGDADHAVALLERVLRQMPVHRELQRVPVLELLVRVRLTRGEHGRAGKLLEELRGIQERVGTGPMRASANRAAGLVVAARDPAQARALLEDAVDGFETSGVPYESAVSRIELGTILLALGDVEPARRELEHASASLRALGALADARRADELLATGSVQVHVPGEAREPTERVTPRERQVLALLAEGLSNRRIGERLGVSEHTVHRHVTNILRKLDLPSRAAAAAHAVRAGLAEPGDA